MHGVNLRRMALALAVAGAVSASPAAAHMGGMWDCARADTYCWAGGHNNFGCGGASCHGNVVENSTTQLMIQGLPASYAPGQDYDITVWVVGAPIYTFVDNGCRALGLVPGFNNLAGFNLELGAGTQFAPLPTGTLTTVEGDTTTQVRPETQCDEINRFTGCGYEPTAACAAPPDCDDTTVIGYQATHALGGTMQLSWKLRWTAPDPGVGDVKFFLAGNVVNGNCRPDIGDRWTVAGGTTVHQAP